MKQSKEFMLLFRLTPDFSNQPTAQELAEQHQQWGKFIGNLALKEKLVSTYQLGFEGKQVDANRNVTEGIYGCDHKTIGGNMIVKVNAIEEAVEISKDCPILAIGGHVEIREILSMD